MIRKKCKLFYNQSDYKPYQAGTPLKNLGITWVVQYTD